MSDECTTYFQFPLTMLRPEKPDHYKKAKPQRTDETIQRIVSYTIWHYGLSLHNKAQDQIETLAEDYAAAHPKITFDKKSYEHKVVMAAASRLNVNLGCVDTSLSRGKALCAEHGEHGTQCRIRSDLLWSAHNEDWPLVKWKTLCGVVAGIGADPYKWLTYSLIQSLGAGYKSPRECKADDLLPKSSVRYWIGQLWMQNVFQICGDKNRLYYSIRHADDRALALELKNRPIQKRVKKRINTSMV